MSNQFCATVHLLLFISKQCIIKQFLALVFVISGKIKVEVSVFSRAKRPRLMTLTSTLFQISQKPHPIIVYYYELLHRGMKSTVKTRITALS